MKKNFLKHIKNKAIALVLVFNQIKINHFKKRSNKRRNIQRKKINLHDHRDLYKKR